MINKIGIIGTGIMGRGIAQVCLLAGYKVYIFDINQVSLEKAVTAMQQAEDLVKVNLLKELGDCDMIIEAITEKVAAKKMLLQELENIVSVSTILASNTSGISITEIASSISTRQRVIGTHFFNPAPKMKLVEIICGVETSLETLQKTTDFISSLGKTPIQVKDVPGFVVNKIITPLLNEAIQTLESGAASAEDIDTAIKLAMGHPLGPLELVDLIGLDTLLYFMEDLYEQTGSEKYKPADLHKQMVAAGYLGRKSGKGFYDYAK